MTTERKKPLPYFRWHVRDHRAHRVCRSLSCFEEGMLHKLLDEQWEEGAVPADADRIAVLVGEPIGVVAQAWEKLSQLFEDVPGSDGFYVRNRRLELERTEADELRVKKSMAGRMGGRPKAAKSRGLQGDLLLEGEGDKSLPEAAMGKHPKAAESSGKQPSQERSSSSEGEKSRRESPDGPCPRCGGPPGFHAGDCILGLWVARGAAVAS